MTVTYGFYDSLAGDRKYNARQMSQLFKGIIADGVFSTVGGGLGVTVNSGMTLNVASGRAWFNFTWTDNDATITVTIQASEAVLNRIDTVVIEVNTDVAVRANSIKVIKGTPASSPVAPTLANTTTLHQYPLANVSVLAGVTAITSDKITNLVGTAACPFATGAVPTFDFAPTLASWQTQFNTWYTNLVNQLSGSQVTNLQAQIDVLTANIQKVDNYQIVPTIVSNNLVLSIKTLAGTDPSGSDPIRIKVGNTVYSLTAATSFTKNAGTSWMNMGSANLATKDVDLFLYAIAETGASAGLKFGYSRMPYGKTMGDFVNSITSPTNERAVVGNYVNYITSDVVSNLGRFRVRLSAGAGYTWSMPDNTVVNRPIYETDWLSFATVMTSGTGTITSHTVNEAVYQVAGKNLIFETDVSIVNNGTGGAYLNETLPWTPVGASLAMGFETVLVGTMLQGGPSASSMNIITYNNGYPGGTGYRIKMRMISRLSN